MMKRTGVVVSCIGTILFPWPFSAFLAVVLSVFEPWLPLAIGILIDVLYFSPSHETVPYFALCGAAITAIAFFVRSRLEASIIRE